MDKQFKNYVLEFKNIKENLNNIRKEKQHMYQVINYLKNMENYHCIANKGKYIILYLE